MSDKITHECGIALVRLLKPLQYFEQKYKSPLYAFNQLFMLMEKQHNRGQDGAGIGTVKLNMPIGKPYMFRERSIKTNALLRVFDRQLELYNSMVKEGLIIPEYAPSVKEHFEFGGEILMGHLRYGTSGHYNLAACHPYFRRSNWATKNLMVLGNFNMTNASSLNQSMVERGQHPIFDTDTQTILEEIGYYLDEEHTQIYRKMRDEGISGAEIPDIISRDLDVAAILSRAASTWDGGYTIAGLIGNGDSFVMRDPRGIRPCFYFKNEELVAFASERVPLMTVFNVAQEDVVELKPGHCVVIKNSGEFQESAFSQKTYPRSECSFERIYFSRGNDADIYEERKALGAALVPQIMDAIGSDLKHAVFSYVPNTAETAYYGMLDGLHRTRRLEVKSAILEAQANGELTDSVLDELIMENWPRGEKIAHKDIKLRTFISQEQGRGRLVSHVYDITYGLIKPDDSLVVLDDSIVRGTTLRKSILKILAKTSPKQIVIVSTAPQIRYPDCYGIDMSELGKFIAFQAAIALLKKRGREDLILEVYQLCCEQDSRPDEEMVNYVKRIYEPFTAEEISAEISKIVYPDISWNGEVKIIFQTIENLHESIPNHVGDWYFTGRYPTAGGYAVLNRAFINYYDERTGRSYS